MGVIDEVKGRLDIVEFVGRYVQLQRAGRNYKALCPFHVERTPSFLVFPDRQSWHCFGACGTGGDIFTFVMRRESMEFGQAMRYLAQAAGVTVPERSDRESAGVTERIWQANEEGARFYHQVLTTAGPALAYLEGRGLDEPTVQEFELGYSPDSWDALRQHLRRGGFSDAEMLSAGLLVEGERGPYDRFRRRLMFPIRDANGRVVGFGGRSLPGSDGQADLAEGEPLGLGPKYLNTPQTPAFDKGRLLYGLDRAKRHILEQGQAIIVEGYMDVIAAHQHGFGNVVASMGTALTRQQVSLLRRYTSRLALALDADPAGIEAALRILEGDSVLGVEALAVPTWTGVVRQLATIGVDVQVIPLPAGTDPDRFIRTDPEGWRGAVATATPMVDFVLEVVLARTDRSSAAAKAEAVQRLRPLLNRIGDAVVQAHYIQRLSLALGLREQVVLGSLRQREGRRSEGGRLQRQTIPLPTAGEPLEEYLLALLLRHPALRPQAQALSEDLFWRTENRVAFTAWLESEDEVSLRRNLVEDLHPHLDRLWAKNVPLFDDQTAVQALEDCLQRLERRQLTLVKVANTAALAQSQEAVDMAEAVTMALEAWRSGQKLAAAEGETAAGLALLYIADTETGLKLHQKDSRSADDQGESRGG